MDSLYTKQWFKNFDFKTILDIGANTGQFLLGIHPVFPNARIFSFEPIPDCYQELMLKSSTIKNKISFNLALGEEAGSFPFERNRFTPSSSFLKMLDLHKEVFPATKQTESINVKMDRLDTVAKNLLIEEPMLIKIDVQGMEDRVIRGGKETIRRADMVVVETSFEPLYENQAYFDDVYQLMKELGFQYYGYAALLEHPEGHLLQEDAVFMKKSLYHLAKEKAAQGQVDQPAVATASQ